MAKRDEVEEGENRDDGLRLSPGTVAAVVVGLALALFVGQNTRDTPVKWLTFETTQPLWLVLLVTAAATLVITELAGRRRRRRKRRS